MGRHRVTLAALGVLLAVAIISRGRCLSAGLEELPEEARKEFNSTRAELSTLRKKLEDLDRRANQDDPLLRFAKEQYEVAERNRLTAQANVDKDQSGFVASGRGTESDFAHWRLHYANQTGLQTVQEKLADTQFGPLLLWYLRFRLGAAASADPAAAPPQVPSRDANADLSAEEVLQRYRELSAPSVEMSRKTLEAIDGKVRPTQQECQHVRDVEWWTAIKVACRDYIESSKPQEARKLTREIRLVNNRLTSIWPSWKDVEVAQLLEQRRLATEATLRQGLSVWRIVFISLTFIVTLALLILAVLRRSRTAS